jgi:RNA polymerase sigma-70 factor (ECF subfamily)
LNRIPAGGVLLAERCQFMLAEIAYEGLLSGEDAADREREFEARLSECSTLAFRVAFAVLRQREDAEDVAQEALVRSYQNFRSLRDPLRFRPWLVRICWRLALDHQRARQRRARREQAGTDLVPMPNAEEAASTNEFRQRLWREIDRLPERLRIVVVLAAIEGHGLREVAGLTGLPEGTVKSRLHHARKRLAARLR